MTTPVQGQQFNPDEEMTERWRKVWNEAPVQALAGVEGAAKQMIVVTTGLQGLYVAIFAFSTIQTQVWAISSWGLIVIVLVILFAPVVCWVVSLFYAMRVFVPRVQPSV
jgi:hypothetical protein